MYELVHFKPVNLINVYILMRIGKRSKTDQISNCPVVNFPWYHYTGKFCDRWM